MKNSEHFLLEYTSMKFYLIHQCHSVIYVSKYYWYLARMYSEDVTLK